MSNDHSHGPGEGHSRHGAQGGHGHHHAPARFDGAFAIGVVINLLFVGLQVAIGLAANSMAVLADAAHNFGDVLGLGLAWGAAVLGRRQPSARRTYGWGRGTILASLANAIVLLIGVGAIVTEAIQRFSDPSPIASGSVMRIAALGIFINGATALLFIGGRKGELNVRAAFLHLAADAVISGGVVVAGALMAVTGALWIDSVTSLLIAVAITVGTWGVLRESVNLAMDVVPANVDPAEVEACLAALPGVREVHDLHIWALSTTQVALTAHLVREDDADPDAMLRRACADVTARFRIAHATVQIETLESAGACGLRSPEVV